MANVSIAGIFDILSGFTPHVQAEIAGELLNMAGVSLDTYTAFMQGLNDANKGELIARCEEEE